VTGAPRFEILEHVPTGAVVLRADFTVLFWNRMVETWTGIPRARALGRSLLTLEPRLDDARFRERIEDVFRAGPPAFFSSKLHGHFLTAPLPNGGLRRQQTTVAGLEGEPGEAALALVIIEDVTELTRSVDAYRGMRDKALAEVETRRAAEVELMRSRESLRATVAEKEVLLEELKEKVDKVATLSGMLPICAHCKKIRDDRGYWERVEAFISKHAGTAFTHGICPECYERYFSKL
jgi:PAS domain S-box-containing protein